MRRYVLYLFALMNVATWGCSENESPTIPVPSIPVPFGLRAVIGADHITLSWEADATFVYSGFAVHRSEDGGDTWAKISTATVRMHRDATVRTGALYLYAVAGINSSGVAGKRSSSLAVRASFFAVQINDGAEFTNSREVSLRLSAPSGTQLVRFSEDPSLIGAPWQAFKSLFGPVTVGAGDGLKRVYAQFTDPSGFVTETFADSILLDTQAAIQSATFTPGGPVPPGATLHFVVTPVGNERDGIAEVSIASFATRILASDDGTNGDPIAGDGVYERNFAFPSSFRGTDLVVSATFTDAALNKSASVELSQRLSFTDPPAAVTLFPPVDSTTTSVTLRWTASSDGHFNRYELYRGTTPSVSKLTSQRVATITPASSTTFTDKPLQEGSTYYYVVYVCNDLDECTASNVRMARTDDLPPTPVVLDPPSAVGPSRLTLTWSRNNDTDFQEYRVYRATTPGVTTASLEIATITDRFRTFFDDSGLDTTSNRYYYRVYVFDRGGKSARSNEVSSP